jgi:hypothetical protein
MPNFSGYFAENGALLRATHSRMVCVRWVRHAYVRGEVLLRRLGWYGETVAAFYPSAGATCVSAKVCELRPMHPAGSGCLNCHGGGSVPLLTPR